MKRRDPKPLVSPNALVTCNLCNGQGLARYTPDGDRRTCHQCRGAGALPLKKRDALRLY